MTTAETPTPVPASEMKRIPFICICCGKKWLAWTYADKIESMKSAWLPLDGAYSAKCAKCSYQTVPADAPLHMPRVSDPERTIHSRRKSGGLHTEEWHVGR